MIPQRSSFAPRLVVPTELPSEEPRGGRDAEHLRELAAAEDDARQAADRLASREIAETVSRRGITREDVRRIQTLEHQTQLVRADTTVTRADAMLSAALWFAIGAGGTYIATRLA